ncbi:MAG: hypothetical protein HQK49_19430 [Oligoflexia bacterium]|nr:hypothetical protein [Oligoflexia bacterium]
MNIILRLFFRPLLLGICFLLPHLSHLALASYIPEIPLKNAGVLSPDKDSFFDLNVDYSKFYGRITDRDKSGNVYKIKVENNNIKFFRASDALTFTEVKGKQKPCEALVRGVEDYYITIYVSNLSSCKKDEEFFRIGTQLNLNSEILRERVHYASQYRAILLKMRSDFLSQLSEINNYIANHRQEEIKVAADYDKKIVQLQLDKRRALDKLTWEKKENIRLQAELIKKMDSVDEGIKYYRVEREEHLVDRWHLDRDLGLPVGNQPQEAIKVENVELFY